MYISDTGAETGSISPQQPSQPASFNQTVGKRTIYAYDVLGNGTFRGNKRSFFLSQDWVPDGLKVAANGYVVTGTGKGVDVLDGETGAVVVRVQTNYTVQNFAWTGEGLMTLWMMGEAGISRVEWGLEGQGIF